MTTSDAPTSGESTRSVRWTSAGANRYAPRSEEVYFLLEGAGRMEVDGDEREVGPGDAVLIPPGAWHQITASAPLHFLCCCAPPYSHGDTFFE